MASEFPLHPASSFRSGEDDFPATMPALGRRGKASSCGVRRLQTDFGGALVVLATCGPAWAQTATPAPPERGGLQILPFVGVPGIRSPG